MIDQAARAVGPAECADRERHGRRDYRSHRAAVLHGRSPTPVGRAGTLDAVVADINYGPGTPGDDELRLCGEVGDGKRAVELGISPWFNSVGFARAGAKSIAVDTDTERIAETRRRATDAEVQVQCLETDLADLGDVASASCDVVLAAHTIDRVDDLGRLLRQVHRILKPGLSLVMSMPHPYADISPERPYGTGARTIGEWFTALTRANFRVDQLLELGATADRPAPAVLILRARKEGS